MFTLKIHWARYDDNGDIADSADSFYPADAIHAGSKIQSIDEMSNWPPGSYKNMTIDYPGVENSTQMDARIIEVVHHNRDSEWFLCSAAWILGSDGKTIEKLV